MTKEFCWASRQNDNVEAHFGYTCIYLQDVCWPISFSNREKVGEYTATNVPVIQILREAVKFG